MSDLQAVAGHTDDVRVLVARVDEAQPHTLALLQAQRLGGGIGLAVDGHRVVRGLVGGAATPHHSAHHAAHAAAAHHPAAAHHAAHHPAHAAAAPGGTFTRRW